MGNTPCLPPSVTPSPRGESTGGSDYESLSSETETTYGGASCPYHPTGESSCGVSQRTTGTAASRRGHRKPRNRLPSFLAVLFQTTLILVAYFFVLRFLVGLIDIKRIQEAIKLVADSLPAALPDTWRAIKTTAQDLSTISLYRGIMVLFEAGKSRLGLDEDAGTYVAFTTVALLAGLMITGKAKKSHGYVIVLAPSLLYTSAYLITSIDPSSWWDTTKIEWDTPLRFGEYTALTSLGLMVFDLLFGKEGNQGNAVLLAPSLVYAAAYTLLSVHAVSASILDYRTLLSLETKQINAKIFSQPEAVVMIFTQVHAMNLLLAYGMLQDFYSRISSRRSILRMLMIGMVVATFFLGISMLPIYYLLHKTLLVGTEIPREGRLPTNRNNHKRELEYLLDPIPEGKGALNSWIQSIPFPLNVPLTILYVALGAVRFSLALLGYFFYVFAFCLPVSAVFFSLRRSWKTVFGKPYQGAVFAPFETVNGQIFPFKAVLTMSGHLRLLCFKYQNNVFFTCFISWWLRNLLESYLMYEFLMPFRNDFTPYCDFLMSEFGPVFPHGQGLGFGAYKDVKSLMHNPDQRKGNLTIAWEISSSKHNWSKNGLTYLPKLEIEKSLVAEGRELIQCFLQDVSKRLQDPSVRKRLDSILPFNSLDGSMVDHKLIVTSFGSVLFHLLTDGEFTEEERKTYFVSILAGVFPFMSDQINKIWFGGILERKGIETYDVIRRAFLRYLEADALQRTLAKAEENNWDAWEGPELVRFLTYKFIIAGGAAPALLTGTIVKNLFADDELFVKYKAGNDHQRRMYILEMARHDRGVPFVNFLAHNFKLGDGKKYVEMCGQRLPVPDGTPLHCSVPNANRDITVFGDDAAEINLDRDPSVIGKMLSFNGCYNDIQSAMRRQPQNLNSPPRRCPGYGYGLDIVQYLVDRYMPVDSYPEAQISAERLEHIQKRESWFLRSVLHIGRATYAANNRYFPHASEVKHPRDTLETALGTYIVHAAGERNIPIIDEDVPSMDRVKDTFTSTVLRIFPIEDADGEWESANEAVAWRMNWFSSNFPPVNIDYTKCKSTANLVSQMAFAGLCCLHTEKVESLPVTSIAREKCESDNAVYVNDNTALGSFKVRRGFMRYGAAAYFDGEYNLIGIYTCCDSKYHPRPVNASDDLESLHLAGWRHAMWAWRVSALALVTVQDHLVNVHMIAANSLVSASRGCLPVDHPVRAFLKIFTFHTISINNKAYKTLIMRKGVVNRNWAFEEDDLQQLFFSSKNNFKKNFRDHIPESMRDVEDFPANHDLVNFCDVVTNLVRGYLFEVYSSPGSDSGSKRRLQRSMNNDSYLQDFLENLAGHLGLVRGRDLSEFDDVVDVLTSLICSCTGMHELVGQISDYFADPKFCGTTIRRGKEIDSIQTYQLNCTLVSSTGLRMPRLLGNWEHLLSRDRFADDTIPLLKKFHSELQALSMKIDQLNDPQNENHRRFAMAAFNPVNMESSVSV